MKNGFTLLELTFSIAIFSVVAVMGIVAMTSATQAIELSRADASIQQSVREVMMAVQNELEQASRRTDPSLDPPLNPVRVNTDVSDFIPVEIMFQRPVDQSGMEWTNPLVFRYLNEDLNDNGMLDNGEDADGDGVLSQRLLRIDDLDQDGEYEFSEAIVVGGANNLSDVQFVMTDDLEGQVTIVVAAEQVVGQRNQGEEFEHARKIRAQTTSTVYVLN